MIYLSRRLQTIVTKKLGFKTPYQARQAVIHGHIMIGERKDGHSIIYSYSRRREIVFILHQNQRFHIVLEKTKEEQPTVDAPEETLRLLKLRLLQLRLLQLRLLQLKPQKMKVLQQKDQNN